MRENSNTSAVDTSAGGSKALRALLYGLGNPAFVAQLVLYLIILCVPRPVFAQSASLNFDEKKVIEEEILPPFLSSLPGTAIFMGWKMVKKDGRQYLATLVKLYTENGEIREGPFLYVTSQRLEFGTKNVDLFYIHQATVHFVQEPVCVAFDWEKNHFILDNSQIGIANFKRLSCRIVEAKFSSQIAYDLCILYLRTVYSRKFVKILTSWEQLYQWDNPDGYDIGWDRNTDLIKDYMKEGRHGPWDLQKEEASVYREIIIHPKIEMNNGSYNEYRVSIMTFLWTSCEIIHWQFLVDSSGEVHMKHKKVLGKMSRLFEF